MGVVKGKVIAGGRIALQAGASRCRRTYAASWA